MSINYFYLVSLIINLIIYINHSNLYKIYIPYDKPDNLRKFHKNPVLISGGLIIFLNYNESQDSIASKLSLKNTALKKSTDLRNYGIGSQILVDIGVTKMKLLAAPRKMPSMTGYGLQVTEFIENNL